MMSTLSGVTSHQEIRSLATWTYVSDIVATFLFLLPSDTEKYFFMKEKQTTKGDERQTLKYLTMIEREREMQGLS